MRKRKEKPVEVIPEMEGYTMEKKTISILAANIWALVVMVVLLIVGFVLMSLLWDELHFFGAGFLLIIAIIPGFVVHELIHGFTWMLVTHSSFSHLRFGAMTGAIYCHIDVPMKKRGYVIGALMPLVILGIVPFVLSFALNSIWLMIFGVILIAGAMGDVMIVWALRHEPKETLVYDHPSEAGCVVYHR